MTAHEWPEKSYILCSAVSDTPKWMETMAKASARHILVQTEQECEDLKKQITDGANFVDVAKEHSKCPSGREGGALGEFSPGMMVPEFDKVVFKEDVGVVHGPVETQFGFHLIEITDRQD